MTTRLFLENGLIPGLSPAFDAAWNVTTSADRVVTQQTIRRGSTIATKGSGSETSASAVNVLNRQFISPPLSGAQTITGTVKGQIRSFESSLSADARAQIVIRVVSNDGTTVRGTLLAADTGTLSSEFSTALTNRKYPLAVTSPAALGSVSALDGDRIVIEIGARLHNTSTAAFSHSESFGSAAGADLTEDETTTTANNPWIEFSQTLTFKPGVIVGGTATQVLVKAVGKARVGGVSTQVLVKSIGRTRVGGVSMQVLIGAAIPTPAFSGWGTPL